MTKISLTWGYVQSVKGHADDYDDDARCASFFLREQQ
jgi:hypothetical protein